MNKELENDKISLPHQFCFQAYGVKVGLKTNAKNVLEQIKKNMKVFLPNGFTVLAFSLTEQVFNNIISAASSFEVMTKPSDSSAEFTRSESETFI